MCIWVLPQLPFSTDLWRLDLVNLHRHANIQHRHAVQAVWHVTYVTWLCVHVCVCVCVCSCSSFTLYSRGCIAHFLLLGCITELGFGFPKYTAIHMLVIVMSFLCMCCERSDHLAVHKQIFTAELGRITVQ